MISLPHLFYEGGEREDGRQKEGVGGESRKEEVGSNEPCRGPPWYVMLRISTSSS